RGRQDGRREGVVLDTRVDRAAELQVLQEETRPVIERASPAHEAEATIAFEVGGEQRPLGGESMPDVDPIPLVGERSLVAAEPELESVVEAVVEITIQEVRSGIGVLERELVGDGPGQVAFKVEASPRVEDAAAGEFLIRVRIDTRVELLQRAD